MLNSIVVAIHYNNLIVNYKVEMVKKNILYIFGVTSFNKVIL